MTFVEIEGENANEKRNLFSHMIWDKFGSQFQDFIFCKLVINTLY